MHIISLLDSDTRDEFRPAINGNIATYLVGPVEASDLQNDINGWNEKFTEEVVAQGYLLQDISYELVARDFNPLIGPKFYIKVTADATEWLKPEHEEEYYSV